ncbi:HlyD family secretion protein [Ferrimonas balearica]|uniref:HlyD family secretion protein n=1 Tax=Ferrimonas balearica TaxID=44012 RepID=UPI001F3C2C53|nr:HlyD family efflux transporter periplasmic adaptor subunit [Ferrimonas balearica]MBY6016796.1 HlyD family efflux transporter periplasmic adaptor subunit [Halomonas denitrificans]MBY6094911.1 HlyD family efflux transporter periplasmic adaptor subunit [Ferrimonas balearica]
MRSGMVVLAGMLLSACSYGPEHLALGTLERDRVALTATVNEVVVSLPVAQGQAVQTGQVLVQLDDRQQRSVVARAEAEVIRAQANLEKLRNGAREEEVAAAQARVAGARATLLDAQQTYQRNRDLVARKMISQADLDRALANRDAADANLRSAQEQLRELTNGTREEDLRMAEAELAANQASLESERKRLSDLTITATRDGVLDNLPWNLGERVTVGSPVAVVLAGDAPYARVYVPEPYRVHIRTGSELTVHIDGLPDPIEGSVRWISQEPAFTPYYALNQEERARLMYLAEVQLPASAANLPSGVPVQVDMPGGE